MLLHLVPARDAEVDAALADKCRNVSRGEEDECDRQVFNECNVEPVFAPELDVGALEEIERRLVQPALCGSGELLAVAVCADQRRRMKGKENEEKSRILFGC